MQKIAAPFEKTVVEPFQAAVRLYHPRQKQIGDVFGHEPLLDRNLQAIRQQLMQPDGSGFWEPDHKDLRVLVLSRVLSIGRPRDIPALNKDP